MAANIEGCVANFHLRPFGGMFGIYVYAMHEIYTVISTTRLCQAIAFFPCIYLISSAYEINLLPIIQPCDASLSLNDSREEGEADDRTLLFSILYDHSTSMRAIRARP